MKITLKMALCIVAILTLSLACIQCIGMAEEVTSGDWSYKLTPSGLTITSYNGSDADVVIPSELDGYLVSVIGRQAFRENYTMRTLTIPEGVTHIQAEAFYGCSALSLINFNARNCTVPEIWSHDSNKGVGVFSGAGSASPSGLKVVFGPEVTRVPDQLFSTASMPEGNGHTGYPIAYVTEVEFSDSITEIGVYAFRNCQLLKSVTLGSNTTTIDYYAFQNCSGITSLVMNDALSFINSYAFTDCTSLSEITWGSGLSSIGKCAFKNCSALVTAEIPNPISTISRQAFANCTSLQTVTLPESLTDLGAEAFYGCVKLGTAYINSRNLTVPEIWSHDENKGVGVFSGAGSSSPSGLKVVFGPEVTRVPDQLFSTASMPEGNGHTGYPFAYVTEVEFSDSIKEIGAYAFRNCQSLKAVSLGNSITTIGAYAFESCTAMTSLEMHDALTFIGNYAFYGCSALNNISWAGGLDTIGSRAFMNCSSIEALELPNPMTTINTAAFANCTALKSVTLPESLTWLGGECFYGCIKLNSVTINSVNLSACEVWSHDSDKGVGIFSGAGSSSPSGLKVVFGPEAEKVPANIFATASLPEGNGHTGYPYAYVTEVIVPESVTEIGSGAFRSCQNLTSVTIAGNEVTFGDEVFRNCTSAAFTIYCNSGSSAEAFAAEAGLASAPISK